MMSRNSFCHFWVQSKKGWFCFSFGKVENRKSIEKIRRMAFAAREGQKSVTFAKSTVQASIFGQKRKRQTKRWPIQPTSLLAVCVFYWRVCPVFEFILSYGGQEVKRDFNCIAQVKICKLVCIPRPFMSKLAFYKMILFFSVPIL